MDERDALELFGTTEPVAPSRRLVAGAFSCALEGGQLRDVRWGDVEVVRGIAYLLRDRDWGTVPAAVGEPVVETTSDGFEVRFTLDFVTPEGRLHANAVVRGSAAGELAFEVGAVADADLVTNRCGFVVLHPAAVAGCALEVEHTTGHVEHTAFPSEICPSQPVFDIRVLAYRVAGEVQVRCRLEAELPHDPAGKFEMEDQRNWSDASFKTYVASLLDPWPYVLPARRRLKQAVRLTMDGPAPASTARLLQTATLSFGPPPGTVMPAMGIGVPPDFHRATPAERDALRHVGAQWWMVESELGSDGIAADLAAVARAREAIAVAVQLDVVVPNDLAPDAAASLAARACHEAGLNVDAVRLLPAAYLKSYQPSDQWPALPPLEAYVLGARRAFPGARIGTGVFTYFTELNRMRPDADEADFIGHATCPIVHAADDLSVMQTIEALPHIARSVQARWPGKAYRIGPSAIAMRRNPYGNAPADNPAGGRLAMATFDPRHHARFGATWIAAYAAALVPFGPEVLALCDGFGPRGPGHCGEGPNAGSMLGVLARAAGRPCVTVDGLPNSVAGIAWRLPSGGTACLLANLTADEVRLRVVEPTVADSDLPLRAVQIRPFDVITVGLSA